MSLSILSAAAGSWGQTCELLPVVNDVRKIYNWLYNIAKKKYLHRVKGKTAVIKMLTRSR